MISTTEPLVTSCGNNSEGNSIKDARDPSSMAIPASSFPTVNCCMLLVVLLLLILLSDDDADADGLWVWTGATFSG